MAANTLGNRFRFAILLFLTALHGQHAVATVEGPDPIPLAARGSDVVTIDATMPGNPSPQWVGGFNYAFFKNRLIYFNQDGRLYSQALSTGANSDVREIVYADGSLPRPSSTAARFRVLDDTLMVQSPRIASSGEAEQRTYRLDFSADTTAVASHIPSANFNAVKHEGYFYTVESRVATGERLSGCYATGYSYDAIMRSSNSSIADAQEIFFGGTRSCRRVRSMHSSRLGLLVTTVTSQPARFTGSLGDAVYRITEIEVVPGGVDQAMSGITATQPLPGGDEQVFDQGSPPYAINLSPFALGSSLFFERQIANYNPYAIGDPNEPAQPMYRTYRYDTTNDSQNQLDFKVESGWKRYGGAIYWVGKNSDGRQSLFRLVDENADREEMMLSPNRPAENDGGITLLGVYGNLLLFFADTGHGQDLHYLARDGQTAVPLYLDAHTVATARLFRGEGQQVVFLAQDAAQLKWSFFRIGMTPKPEDPVDPIVDPGTDPATPMLEPQTDSGVEVIVAALKVQLTFDGVPSLLLPGVAKSVDAKVKVMCEFENTGSTALTDIEFLMKWQKNSGKKRMKRARVSDSCSRSSVLAGERVSCTQNWKVRPGTRKYVCAVSATRSSTGLRQKDAVKGFVNGLITVTEDY